MGSQVVLDISHDFPIRTASPVHSGKVRSVYWLTDADSKNLIKTRGYAVEETCQLGIMIISDRISAFECIWHAKNDLRGVPGKGAALNAISEHWFKEFSKAGLAGNHIVDTPHPLVWVVQRARPIMLEAIVRGYITGSMWRAYSQGSREICGIPLPENLKQDQRLVEPLVTPTTKGVLKGIDGIPEADDVDVSRDVILSHLQTFHINRREDISRYESLLLGGFQLIERALESHGLLFVDTKFEFGYVRGPDGNDEIIYIDEVGTPDSSRIWDKAEYAQGHVVENSKETFRKILLSHLPDPDVLLNKSRFEERKHLAATYLLPPAAMLEIAAIYQDMAEVITGKPLIRTDRPHEEIMDTLGSVLKILQ